MQGLVVASVGGLFHFPILPNPVYPGCDWDMKRAKELSGRRGISTGQNLGNSLRLTFPPGFALRLETEFLFLIYRKWVCVVSVSQFYMAVVPASGLET